jgi:regulator of protease activity HflC (stomatin/prohibitin superfamily)
MKRTLYRLLAVAALAFAAAGCTQIDTGNIGVTSVMGQMKPDVLQPGVYETVSKTVTEICGGEVLVPIKDMHPQTSDKIVLNDLDIDIFVQINPTAAPKIMTRWKGDQEHLKDKDCNALGMNYVTRHSRSAVLQVTSEIGSATIHAESARIEGGVVKELQKSLDADAGKDVFMVKSANVKHLETDPALQKNIQMAANRQFEINSKTKEVELARLEAERQRAEAQGVADAIRIKAEAVSKQGGAEYVQLEALKKWNGVLPTNTQGAIPFINVGK